MEPMAFIKKPFKKLVEGGTAAESDAYIDLGDLTTHVYNGDMLLIDYTSLANDELALKRMTADLKNVARDTGGDVAAVGKNYLLATPAGVKIDRNKIKGSM